MIRTKTIFLKVVLAVILAAGWGGRAWADRLAPEFATGGTSLGASQWYFITFVNKGANQKAFARTSDSKFRYDTATPTNDYKWRFIGTGTDFVIQSASGYYVYNPASGTGNSTEYLVTTNAANATHFRLDNGTDADSWAFQRISNGGGSGNYMNPRNGDVREWSNDGGCRIRLTVTDIEISRWTVNIISSDGIDVSAYRVRYNNVEYASGTEFNLPAGTTLNGTTFQTTCKDKFVWGPVADKATSTVTFDVRSSATTLRAGKFYQMMLRDKSGQVYNGSVQTTSSMVDAINGLSTLRHRGQYIYAITAGVTDWTVELTGIYNTVKEAATYVYVDAVSGGNVSLKMQNGQHVNQNGEGVASGTIPLVYQSGTGAFRWNSNALPWDNLRNSKVGIGNTSRASTGNMEFFFHELDLVEYTLSVRDQYGNVVPASGITYKHDNGLAMDGKLYVPSSKTSFTTADFSSTQYSIEDVTLSGTTILVDVHAPIIVHRVAKFYTEVEAEANKPGVGFVHNDAAQNFGWAENAGQQIQRMAEFRIPIYLKAGTTWTSYLPSDRIQAYQRWYCYDNEGLPDHNVFTNIASWNKALYSNGYVTSGYYNNPTFRLPADGSDYNVGLDISRWGDRQTLPNGDLREPTLSMRVIYQIRDAKQVARAIKEATAAGKFYEEHDIIFPTVKRGTDTYKTGADLLPLNMDLNNYWVFNGSGETDADLRQLKESSSDRAVLTVSQTAGNVSLRNVMLIPASGSSNSGGMARTNFNAGHFITFRYPEGGVVPDKSWARIEVKLDGQNMAVFNLTFADNSEPLLITEVVGRDDEGRFKSIRSREAMEATYGKAVAQLTFDNTSVEDPGSFYKYPMDYANTNYAFGYGGGNGTARGEYALRNSGGLSAGGSYFYYPVNRYIERIKSGSTATHANDEYFLYIDAADQPGTIMSIGLDEKLCKGARLFCYGWIGCTSGGTNQNPASVLLNIVGYDAEGHEHQLASYCPGVITSRGYDAEGVLRDHTFENWAVWNQVGFSFVINPITAANMVRYAVQVHNNCYNSNGGDVVLDDFRVYVDSPKGSVDFTTPLCTDALRHVKVHTDFDMLLQTTGINEEVATEIPVSFCFLDKQLFDDGIATYYDIDPETGKHVLKPGYYESDPVVKATVNAAFGEALIGVRSTEKSVKGHAFHNFVVPLPYEDIDEYAYNDSPDDQVFREKRGDVRRVVFKEQLYQADASEHQWKAGHSYYLLFAPFHVEDSHVAAHDVGTEVFDVAGECCVLTEFSILPPIEIKGDATITASDAIAACENQIVTVTVNIPALKLDDDGQGATDAVVRGLNYDWWSGTSKDDATLAGFNAASYGTYSDADAQHYGVKDAGGVVIDNSVTLASALANMRYFYPEVRTLDTVSVQPWDGDAGYGLCQAHLDCIRHFLTPDANGREPLSLFGKSFNVLVTSSETDADHFQHFVAIPILPKQDYDSDNMLLYCPDPQQVSIYVRDEAPSLLNGFRDVSYPAHMTQVPLRIGRSQAQRVTKREQVAVTPADRTLRIPLRAIHITTASGSTSLQPQVLDGLRYAHLYLSATDDPAFDINEGDDEGDLSLLAVAEVIEMQATDNVLDDAYMDIAFIRGFDMREGYTYTLKLNFEENLECECHGTMLFDVKVVPEFQCWTGAVSDDWHDDRNWARADRSELLADAPAASVTGSVIDGATDFTSADNYATNRDNQTHKSFVPMFFTNVLLGDVPSGRHAHLHSTWQPTRTPDIEFEMEVQTADGSWHRVDNLECGAFRRNVCRGVTFTPGGMLYDASLLDYQRAWVEYELAEGEWYTLASPLQGMKAGEWYSPTAGGRQLTPHFHSILYSETLNDRFRPAYYQRSWNTAQALVYQIADQDAGAAPVPGMAPGNPVNVAIEGNWSNVYNDVDVDYSAGEGFSVKVDFRHMANSDRPASGRALVRLPKDDTSYYYYDIAGDKHNDDLHGAAIDRSSNGRLLTDALSGAATLGAHLANVEGTNNIFLVSNPFMTPLDVDAFFAVNTQFEPAYWLMTGNTQLMSVKDADGWIDASGMGGGSIAPLQAFFVRTVEAATSSTDVSFTAAMQQVVSPAPAPAPRSVVRLVADDGTRQSCAAVYYRDEASDAYRMAEDVPLFLHRQGAGSGVATAPVVYTAASGRALSINQATPQSVIPVGFMADDLDNVTVTVEGENLPDDLCLFDALTGEFHPLDGGFSFSPSADNARFFLMPHALLPSGREALSVSLQWQGNELVLVANCDMHRVEVFDIAGRPVATEAPASNVCRLAVGHSASPMPLLVVKVHAEYGSEVLKVSASH